MSLPLAVAVADTLCREPFRSISSRKVTKIHDSRPGNWSLRSMIYACQLMIRWGQKSPGNLNTAIEEMAASVARMILSAKAALI